MLSQRSAPWVLVLTLALVPLVGAEGLTPEQSRVEARLLERAAANVERFRMGDVQVTLRAPDGEPLAGVPVHVRQERHEFLFGCIAFDLVWDRRPPRPERWKERFRELFNLAVFPFYWPTHEPRQGMPEWARMSEALRWCREEGITAKGHPLVWACADFTEQLVRLLFGHPAVASINWWGLSDRTSWSNP